MSWQIVYAKQALKDAKKLASSGLKAKAEELLRVITVDPYRNPPSFEKLVGVAIRSVSTFGEYELSSLL